MINKLNNQLKGNNFNINSYPLIINNIINTNENKTNNLFENINDDFPKIQKKNYLQNLETNKEYFFILKSKKNILNKYNSLVITKCISNFNISNNDLPTIKISK